LDDHIIVVIDMDHSLSQLTATKTTMRYSVQAIESIGCKIASRDLKDKMKPREFVSFFNRTPDEALELWELCSPNIMPKTSPKHMFWCLMYMKLYIPLDVMAVLLNISVPSLNKWVWIWVESIATRHIDVIHWTKRFQNAPADVWCYITVDGTDFTIGEPTPFNKAWKSPKAKGASLKYKVAISIYSGDIVWIYGPHEGSKHDYRIFKEMLMKMLEADEMVETDAGYGVVRKGVGNDGIIRSKNDYMSKEERSEKSDQRARHETVNRRFKSWGILKQQFQMESNCTSMHSLLLLL
jgi:hypothetical protein